MRNIAKTFLRAKSSYEENSSVQKYMSHRLVEILLSQPRRDYQRIFEFGGGLGSYTKMLINSLQFESYVYNDINDYGLSFEDKRIKSKIFDMSKFGQQDLGQFSLITSNACVQWLDFIKCLRDCAKSLESSGVLLLSTFGEKNLYEIKETTGVGLTYLNLERIDIALRQDFKIVYLDEEKISLSFENALEVFRHLKYSGVNAFGNVRISKAILKMIETQFHNTLTYYPIFIFAIKNKNY